MSPCCHHIYPVTGRARKVRAFFGRGLRWRENDLINHWGTNTTIGAPTTAMLPAQLPEVDQSLSLLKPPVFTLILPQFCNQCTKGKVVCTIHVMSTMISDTIYVSLLCALATHQPCLLPPLLLPLARPPLFPPPLPPRPPPLPFLPPPFLPFCFPPLPPLPPRPLLPPAPPLPLLLAAPPPPAHLLLQLATHSLKTRSEDGQASMHSSRLPGQAPSPPLPPFF